MKKKISLLLAILMLVTLLPTAFAESKTVDAVKNTKKVTLDGEEVMVGAYDVEGYNYLKLRDIAAILNGKKCQFSVGYDEPTKLISVELAKAYEKVEGDLAEIKDEKAKAIVSVKKILVNGEEKEVKTALINENNYMQLRDLGTLVGLGVGYDKVNKVIQLKSDAEEKEEKEEKPEEKEDEKTEDKKDEKKEEVKEEAKVELVPEDKWTEEEKAWFDTQEKLMNFLEEAVIYGLTDDAEESTKEVVNYYDGLAKASIIQGREIFDTHAIKIDKFVEKRADGRYAVIEFNYKSGGIYKVEQKDVKEDAFELNDTMKNVIILELEDGAKDKYKDNNLIYAKLIEFHQAVVDNKMDEAVKILQSIGVKANAENVKEYVDTRKQIAKNLGTEIFVKDFEYDKEYKKGENDDGTDVSIILNYKNGGMLFIGYSRNAGAILGFGMKLK